MKKIILILLVLAALPLAGWAQNKAIENLARKYSERERFSTTVIKGPVPAGYNGRLRTAGVDISKILRDISSIVIVGSDYPNEEFTRDVKRAVASEEYSTIMSSSSNGTRIEFLIRTISEEKKKKKNEFVITVLGRDENLLVGIVGDYMVKQVSKTE